MRRRDFVIALGTVAAVSAPLLGRAQQTGKTYRIAIVSTANPVAQMIETPTTDPPASSAPPPPSLRAQRATHAWEPILISH